MARVDELLAKLMEEQGSDLHLSAGTPPLGRIHGDMRPLGDEPLTAAMTRAYLDEVLAPEVRTVFDATHDVDFSYTVEELGRFRVNGFLDHRGPGAVFRNIPVKIPSFEQLGLPPILKSLCALPKGLVLVTGPTGSGKSTTLAAMIDEINRNRSDHIITIEDPIEFVHPNKGCLVNQREVGPHTGSFARALKAALRQDPDVVLVGEMRDLETTTMAIETAETGHIVFATLHTSSAAGTIDRIIDQYPSSAQAQVRTQLAATLQGVVSQTLLKRRDGKGRVAAMEILIGSPALSAQIREGKTHQINSLIQTGGRLGMTLLNDSLIKLVSRGVIDAATAMDAVTDKEGLMRGFQVANIPFDHSALKGASVGLAGDKVR